MKRIRRSKKRIRVVLIVTLIVTFVSLAGCSVRSRVVGEYLGDEDSYLNLHKDGSCVYAEDDSTGVGMGTWYVSNGVLYINVENLDFTIHADVTAFSGGILLEADSGAWNDEYFAKID